MDCLFGQSRAAKKHRAGYEESMILRVKMESEEQQILENERIKIVSPLNIERFEH